MSTRASDIHRVSAGPKARPTATVAAGGGAGGSAPPNGNGVTPNGKLAARLQSLISERSTTPHAVSRDAKLGSTYVYDIIIGRNKNPSLLAVQAIAKVLGTTLAYLMGEADHVASDGNIKLLDTMPMISAAETGTYRKLSASATYPKVHGPRSQRHPNAQHFALQVADDALNARAGGPPITAGMIALCVDMAEDGLLVETGRLYCVRRTIDGGNTWETLIRRAQVFRDRTLLWAESATPERHEVIPVQGTLAVTRAFPWSVVDSLHVCVIGLVYGIIVSLE